MMMDDSVFQFFVCLNCFFFSGFVFLLLHDKKSKRLALDLFLGLILGLALHMSFKFYGIRQRKQKENELNIN